MAKTDPAREINRGKDILTRIVRVTSDFLERFDTLGPAEIHAFEQKRQQLLEELLAFQSDWNRLTHGEKVPSLAMAKQLEEFRIFKEVFLQIIMRKNDEIISRAALNRDKIRAELDVIGRGKQAMRGYNRKSGRSWNRMEQTA